jgi:hypothetical protein
MPGRLIVLGSVTLLAATLVSGAPAPAGARSTSAGAAVSCATQRLPMAKDRPVHVSASLGGTTAILRGTSGASYLGTPRVRQPRLTLSSGGHVVSTFRPKPVAQTPGHGVLLDGVNAPGHGQPPLCLTRFASGPVALLGVTNAFNQCCFLLRTYAPGVRAGSSLQDGLIMPTVRLISGHPAIVTGDGAFLAKFADYADSAAPLRIITVRGDRQRDVTAQHPTKVRRDAKQWWARFDQDTRRGLGALAAWAADKEQLGQDADVWSTLRRLNAAHKLTGMSGWPRNQSYIDALRSFLGSHGYR